MVEGMLDFICAAQEFRRRSHIGEATADDPFFRPRSSTANHSATPSNPGAAVQRRACRRRILGRERFQHYITQDAFYLGQFSRALAIAAAKAPDAGTLQAFAQSALGAVAVERALHEHYLQGFGVDPAMLADAEPAPDCLAYTSFLLAAAYHEPWEVLIAALLPCFWVYWDVGCDIAGRAAPENPYRAWIATYADPGFGEAVQRVVATANRARQTASPMRFGRQNARCLPPGHAIRVALLGRCLPSPRLAARRLAADGLAAEAVAPTFDVAN